MATLPEIMGMADGSRENVVRAIKTLETEFDVTDYNNVAVQRAMSVLQRMLSGWDVPGRAKGHAPKRRLRIWFGDKKMKHINALGREHTRLERHMENKLQRVFQSQRRAAIRTLRQQAKERGE
jgi:hypothetical protein